MVSFLLITTKEDDTTGSKTDKVLHVPCKNAVLKQFSIILIVTYSYFLFQI